MNNLNLNINQVNSVLNELNKINNVKGRYSLLASPYAVEIRQNDEQSTVKKIVNYFTDWWQGKNENVTNLSRLTGRISQIVKDQKVNSLAISIDDVDNAVYGLKKYQTHFAKDSFESNHIAKAIKDLIYVCDQADRVRFLKDRFPGEVITNAPSLQNAVKELMVQESLNVRTSLSAKDVKEAVDVPSQFAVDCERFNKIAWNDKVIFRQPPKETDRITSIMYKAIHYLYPNPSAAKIGHTMKEKLGDKTFGRLGSLQHQSFIADRIKNWMPTLAENNFHMQQAGGYDFHVKQKENAIQVEGKVLMKLYEVDDDSNSKTLGYVGVSRTVSIPKDELTQDLEGLQIEKRLKGMNVRDVVSPFSWTKDEARAAI